MAAVKDEFFPMVAFEEHLPAITGYAAGPERDLLSALLFDGVQSYLSYALSDSLLAKDKYKEAYAWVHSKDSEYIFSFINVCEALGLDPDSLRLGILNFIHSNQVVAANEEQPTFRRARRMR